VKAIFGIKSLPIEEKSLMVMTGVCAIAFDDAGDGD
jgi:hypothetical protein